MNTTLLISIGLCVVWFCFGWVVRTYVFHLAVSKYADEMYALLDDYEKLLRKRSTKIDIMQTDGQYYAYETDGGKFLAQGESFEALTTVLTKTFPEHDFTISRKNFDDLFEDADRKE